MCTVRRFLPLGFRWQAQDAAEDVTEAAARAAELDWQAAVAVALATALFLRAGEAAPGPSEVAAAERPRRGRGRETGADTPPEGQSGGESGECGAEPAGESGAGPAGAPGGARATVPPLMVVEVTARVRDGQFFLRPDAPVTRCIQGIIGRAQALLRVEVYAAHALSNHVGLLLGVRSVAHASRFCERIFGQIAVRVGLLRGKVLRIWGRRARVIPVDADPVYLVARLRYCLANSVAEHLVRHAREWPGMHSARHFCLGQALAGTWTDGSAWRRAKRRDPGAPEAPHVRHYQVVHSKLPCLRHLDDAAYCAQMRAWCDEDAANAAAQRAASWAAARAQGHPAQGIPEPRGPKAALRVAVTDTPESFEATPAPLLHGSPARQALYRALLQAYRAALAANRARLRAQCAREGTDFWWEGLAPTGVPPLGVAGWPAPLALRVSAAP